MPVVFRYVGWMITLPLQVLTLYFLIHTVASTPTGLFWRLLVASVAMVLARYMGEAGLIYPTLGFLIGLVAVALRARRALFRRAWPRIDAQSASDPVRLGYFWLRLIVTIGWAIYPLSYLHRAARRAASDVANLLGHLQSGRFHQPDRLRCSSRSLRDAQSNDLRRIRGAEPSGLGGG